MLMSKLEVSFDFVFLLLCRISELHPHNTSAKTVVERVSVMCVCECECVALASTMSAPQGILEWINVSLNSE